MQTTRSAISWDIIEPLSHVVSTKLTYILSLPSSTFHLSRIGHWRCCRSGRNTKPSFVVEQYLHVIVIVGLIHDAVHCRRRKIRCLVAPDDTEGRCENCIRLRKDCQFFPVDQQPPIEKKSRPSSRLETPSTERSNTTPIASSPTNLVPDTTETFYPYPTMPMNTTSTQDIPTYNVGIVQSNMHLTPGMLISFAVWYIRRHLID
jgi:hypothetical protein